MREAANIIVNYTDGTSEIIQVAGRDIVSVQSVAAPETPTDVPNDTAPATSEEAPAETSTAPVDTTAE